MISTEGRRSGLAPLFDNRGEVPRGELRRPLGHKFLCHVLSIWSTPSFYPPITHLGALEGRRTRPSPSECKLIT
jgi:hypothetical protein